RPGENSGPPLGEAVQERLLLRGVEKDTVQWDSWRRDDGTWEVMLVYRVAGEPHSASWTYDPPRRLVQAVDEEARSLIGESDDLASAEPSFPFVPRIARLPRDRPLDRSLDRPGLPAAPSESAEDLAATASGERDSLTSLLEAVPSFRGDLVVPERPSEPDADEQPEPEAEEPPAPAASAGSAYADVLMPRSVGSHRDRLIGSTDRQAEADGVRPGRRAAVPSWDEIVFGTRRKKQE
ncbi:MAG TPA: septation protein SepH, partial [Streptomyces sp.]|nr:septation protein SepH [Streptomyces sp.]